MQIRALPPLTQRTHKHTQGGYFTCHGPDAEHVAKEFYSTQTVVRHQCVCVCARACGWVGVLWLAGWVGYVGMHGWTPPALTFSLTYACTHTHSLTHTHVIASRPPLPLRLAQALLHPRDIHMHIRMYTHTHTHTHTHTRNRQPASPPSPSRGSSSAPACFPRCSSSRTAPSRYGSPRNRGPISGCSPRRVGGWVCGFMFMCVCVCHTRKDIHTHSHTQDTHKDIHTHSHTQDAHTNIHSHSHT